MKALVASFVVALASPAWAGVLTVGPAGQFAQVTDALAAAQPGDAILVAPGTYDPFVVDEAVRVFGAGASVTSIDGFGANGVLVQGIASGQEAIVSGFTVRVNASLAPTQASVLVTDCAGTVVLHDVVVDAALPQTALVAQQSGRVVLQRFRSIGEGAATSASPGVGAVRAFDSGLWISDSTIVGGTAGGGFAVQGVHAVEIENGELRVWRSTLTGSDGVGGKGLFVAPNGGHGVRATASHVVLHGGPQGGLSGGDGAIGQFGLSGGGGSGLALFAGSTATVQAALSIVAGIEPVQGIAALPVLATSGSTFTFDPFVHPTLVAGPHVATGGSIAIDAAGHPGAIVAVVVGFHSGPTLQFPGIEGVTFLDPTFFVHPVNALLDPVGVGSTVLGVPTLPELVGAALHLQGVQFVGGGIALTNPATVAVVR